MQKAHSASLDRARQTTRTHSAARHDVHVHTNTATEGTWNVIPSHSVGL